jgi:radical SAM protein with 4Fe4S-binding SPASM domain
MNEFSLLDKSKDNQKGELIVILFEFCNLNCQMCSQNHNDTTGINTITQKFESVSKSLDGLKKKGKTSTTVNLMGGELLADDLPDSVFNDYITLINNIKQYSNEIEFPVTMHLASNMIWKKTARVKNFLDTSGVELAASYDPAGRFNPITFEIFKENIVEFKDYIMQIGVVMTNPSIKKFMTNTSPFFNYLYENFEIVFDHYTPEGEGFTSDTRSKFTNQLLPTDIELREFFKFMLDTWPGCYPFKNLGSKKSQPTSCMSTITIHPTSDIKSCAVYDIKQDAGAKPIVFFGKLTEQKNQWVEDYDCLSCEYMARCSFGCFLNHHTKNIRTQEACWMKEVYDYTEKVHAPC